MYNKSCVYTCTCTCICILRYINTLYVLYVYVKLHVHVRIIFKNSIICHIHVSLKIRFIDILKCTHFHSRLLVTVGHLNDVIRTLLQNSEGTVFMSLREKSYTNKCTCMYMYMRVSSTIELRELLLIEQCKSYMRVDTEARQ